MPAYASEAKPEESHPKVEEEEKKSGGIKIMKQPEGGGNDEDEGNHETKYENQEAYL